MGLHPKKCTHLFIYALVVCALCSPSLAIILHENGEPDAFWIDKPDDLVVGRWSWNACFVAIAPNWIVTTRHQNTSPATVTIDGVSYKCNYDPQWTGGGANADIRLIRLTTASNENPYLATYTIPYNNTDEGGKDIVIGGHGNGRGNVIIPGMRYEWDYASGNSSPLRWATNNIDGADTIYETYTSDIIIADFSTLTSGTDYEGIVAIYDSGGGWFIFDNGQWKVAGLSRAVQFHGTDLYSDTQAWVGDYQDAVRISSYASWIDSIITCNGDMGGDVNDDCIVNFADLLILASNWLRDDCDASNNFCDGADTDPADSYVDMIDFSRVATDWLNAN